MDTRKIVIRMLWVVIGLPVALALVIWVSYYAMISSFAPNRTNGSIVSTGQKRSYLLYVPRSYDPARPAPLVISLHPAMSWPAFQMRVSRWNRTADENGLLVVYPSGTGTGPRAWFMEGAGIPSRMPDVRFVSELIDTLEAAYHIDPTRIYVDGLSSGGGMAFVLSCTLSQRIAAIGAVSAAQSLPWSWCPDSTPVPMVAFHGTADPVVPYGGGKVWIAPRPFPSIRTRVASWARRNRCAAGPVDSAVAAGVTRTQYTSCADDAGGALFHPGRRSPVARRQAAARMDGRARDQQHRRHPRDVGVLSGPSASAGAVRRAAELK